VWSAIRATPHNLCHYRLRGGARVHTHVTPPSFQGRVWSRSQAAGRPQPGAVHRVFLAWIRWRSLRLGV
jgi:hypothetical protein